MSKNSNFKVFFKLKQCLYIFLLYSILSLFAEIGGYVGLLLGVSIWNFAAWISDILELKIQKLQKGEEDPNDRSKVHVVN